jgi:hypothetical protein
MKWTIFNVRVSKNPHKEVLIRLEIIFLVGGEELIEYWEILGVFI